MNDQDLRHQVELEVETMSINKLTEVGNMAVSMGLIAGHGFRGGKYEILQKGKVILLSEREAIGYLDPAAPKKLMPRLNQLLTCWGVTLRWAAKSEGVKPHSWSRALRRSPDVFMAASVAAGCQLAYEPDVDAACAKCAWL